MRLILWCFLTIFSLTGILFPGAAGQIAREETSNITAETLDMESAVQAALDFNPAFKLVQAQKDSALASVKNARSGYYPQVSGSLTHSYSDRTNHSSESAGFSGNTDSSSTSLGISAGQTIYDFGRRARSLEQSRYSVDLADLELKQQTLSVGWGAVSAYLKWLEAEHSVQVRVEGLNLAKKHLTSAQAKLEVGRVSPLDVAKEKSNVASAESSLIAAQNLASTSLQNLIQIMGKSQSVRYRPVEPDEFLPDLIPEESELIAGAIQSRPDIVSLQIELQQKNAQLRLAKSQYLPTISADAQASVSGDNTPFDSAWSVSGGLRLTIFDGFSTRAGIESAVAQTAMIKSQIEQLELSVRTEVINARRAMIDAEKREVAAREALDYAKESLDLAEGRYEAGLASELERADALQTYLNSNDSYYQAQNDRRLAWAALNQAAGRATPGVISK